MTIGADTASAITATPSRLRVRFSLLPTFLLALLLFGSALLRFGGLDREGRWCDEYHQTMSYGMSPWYVILSARSAVQPPMDYLLGWAIHKVSPSVWAMRAPAVVFGWLSIYLTFVLVRRLSDWPMAFIAASLVAFSPVHFRLSQTARPYTIFLFFLLLMIWAMVRALEKPDRRRLVLFGACAVALMLTRGLAPPVILLSAAIGLAAVWMTTSDVQIRCTVRRVLIATVCAGVVAAPVTLFLVLGDQSWSRFGADPSDALGGYESHFTVQVGRNLQQWAEAPSHYFASIGGLVAVLAGCGLVGCIVRWKSLSSTGGAVVATFAIAGPLYIIVYTLAVRQWPISYRYAFFLLPFVASMTGIALMGITRAIVHRMQLMRQYRTVLCLVMGLGLVAIEARATIRDSRFWFNPDWRGCAAYLQGRVTDQDVVMVLQDRALGEYQPTFWGKYDWPKGFDAPLAEAVWTFVTSDSHWWRLVRQRGKCIVVLRHDFDAHSRDSFREGGLDAAPRGATLVRFRGLNVLELETNLRGLAAIEKACEMLLDLPLRNPDAKAIPLALLSRIHRSSGDEQSAEVFLKQARMIMPDHLRSWFDRMTAGAGVR